MTMIAQEMRVRARVIVRGLYRPGVRNGPTARADGRRTAREQGPTTSAPEDRGPVARGVDDRAGQRAARCRPDARGRCRARRAAAPRFAIAEARGDDGRASATKPP